MQAYEAGLRGDTRMLLKPDSDFFRYFVDPSGRPRPGSASGAPASGGAMPSTAASVPASGAPTMSPPSAGTTVGAPPEVAPR
jgi:membrane protease subunit HflC